MSAPHETPAAPPAAPAPVAEGEAEFAERWRRTAAACVARVNESRMSGQPVRQAFLESDVIALGNALLIALPAPAGEVSNG